jgi:hypothetical protein
MTNVNELGQPIGFPLPDWTPCEPPPRTPMMGRTCRLELLDAARHAADLHAANLTDTENRIWTYMGYGPLLTLPPTVHGSKRMHRAMTRCFTPLLISRREKPSASPVISGLSPRSARLKSGTSIILPCSSVPLPPPRRCI